MDICLKIHVLLCFLQVSVAGLNNTLSPTMNSTVSPTMNSTFSPTINSTLSPTMNNTLRPAIDGLVAKVTAAEGETAILPCHIENLGEYQVGWVSFNSGLLIVQDRRFTDDLRCTMENPSNGDWNLHIKNVTFGDEGQYMCRVNTDPPTSKIIVLTVIVPVKIRSDLSSNDTTVREGETLVLICTVAGIPTPRLKWYKFTPDGKQNMNVSEEILIIENVTRSYSGTYECVAKNGAVARRRFKVTVQGMQDGISSGITYRLEGLYVFTLYWMNTFLVVFF